MGSLFEARQHKESGASGVRMAEEVDEEGALRAEHESMELDDEDNDVGNGHKMAAENGDFEDKDDEDKSPRKSKESKEERKARKGQERKEKDERREKDHKKDKDHRRDKERDER